MKRKAAHSVSGRVDVYVPEEETRNGEFESPAFSQIEKELG
jgi:hypothetical protein